MFASNNDYILKALSFTEQLKINNPISVALKKIFSDQVTAGKLTNIFFPETVKWIITKDDAHRFMGIIKGTSTYWKKF